MPTLVNASTISIPTWFDSYIRSPLCHMVLINNFNSNMVRFILLYYPQDHSYRILFQFQHGSIHTIPWTDPALIYKLNFNSNMVRFILCLYDLLNYRYIHFNSNMVRFILRILHRLRPTVCNFNSNMVRFILCVLYE